MVEMLRRSILIQFERNSDMSSEKVNGEAGGMNSIGKFEVRKIVNQFDASLIELFGVNMSDAGISRHEAMNAYTEVNCPRKAAEIFGQRRGLALQTAV